MTETTVKERLCDVCGVDIRDGSVFCYNCGSALRVAAESSVDPAAKSIEMPSEPLGNGNASMDSKTQAHGPGTPYGPRKRARKRVIEPREVVWQERAGFGWGFLAAALFLVFITVVILGLGFYFR